MTNQPTAAQIKAHRKSLGLTQQEYAKLVGVAPQTVGHWECGRSPGAAIVAKLQSVMQMKPTPKDSPHPSAEQIKAHRLALGMSQNEYANHIGASSTAVGRWERGVRGVHDHYIEALVAFMDSRPVTNLGGTSNPQTITIDWQGLVSEHQGIRGVSLRHLVSLGLYANYRNAREALDRAEVGFLRASAKTSHTHPEGGRPSEDTIITDLRLVQMFCVSAQTPLGNQLRDVVIAHHNELQAMLAGDADAQARHEQAKTPQPSDPLDALAAMIEQMRQQRDRQQQLEREVETTKQTMQLTTDLMTDTTQRLAAVETALNTTPVAGHLSAYQVAERAKCLSSTGRPHAMAVAALALHMGLDEEGEAYQVMTEINDHICPSWRYTPRGAAMLLNELNHLSSRAQAPFFNVKSGSKTYTVYRAQ